MSYENHLNARFRNSPMRSSGTTKREASRFHNPFELAPWGATRRAGGGGEEGGHNDRDGSTVQLRAIGSHCEANCSDKLLYMTCLVRAAVGICRSKALALCQSPTAPQLLTESAEELRERLPRSSELAALLASALHPGAQHSPAPRIRPSLPTSATISFTIDSRLSPRTN